MNQTIKYGKSRMARFNARRSYSFELTSIRRLIETGKAARIRAGVVKVG